MLLVSLGAPLAFASAASAADLNIKNLRKALVATATKDYAPARIGEATCPSKVKQQKGLTFTCTVVVAGLKLPYEITQKDGNGNVHAAPSKALLSLDKMATALKSNLVKENPGTTKVILDCGTAPVIMVAPGGTFHCDAALTTKSGPQTGGITITVTDVSGNVTFEAD